MVDSVNTPAGVKFLVDYDHAYRLNKKQVLGRSASVIIHLLACLSCHLIWGYYYLIVILPVFIRWPVSLHEGKQDNTLGIPGRDVITIR